MDAEACSGEEPGGCRSLRVAEAAAKDVGRGIARLDPRDLAALGAEVGDVLTGTGGRTTVAKATPAYADQRGKGLVQLDGITRGNARVGLDQRVQIARVSHAAASRIIL